MKEKSKNNKIFADELKRTIPIYLLGMAVNAIVIYILYKIPTITGKILDLLTKENIKKELIMKEVYSLIFYSVILIIPRIIERNLLFSTARASDTYLRSKVIEHLQSVKPEYYEKEEKGVFLAYLSKELLAIRRFLGNAFFNISRLIIAPIIGLVVIGVNFNPLLSLSMIPIIPFAAYRLYKLKKKQQEALEHERKVYIKLSNTIEQNTSGFQLIKLYNEQENQKETFEKINEETYQADYSTGKVLIKIDNAIDIIYASCYCLGVALGLILIKNGELTIGELTAYISCISIAISEIVHSISPLLGGIAYYKQAKKRFNYFFNLEGYKKEGKELKNIEKIEIKNLSYSYEGNTNYAIENINMTINKGEKIGIVGKVGSGKTTLMNIIAGFYEISDEQVFINGLDINKYSREALFENIGYAMQKNIIMDDTIKNNINIREEATDSEIEEVLKKADIYDEIQKMKDGLNTRIGENGVKVSGGQKQRIQIARNLLNVRPINIFDDTLSALDIQTEQKVLEEITKQVGKNTLIVISNKISMMEKMDKVYLLVDGKITAQGTHQHLLETNELYNELNNYEKVGGLI